MAQTLNHAFDVGINYIDLAVGRAPLFQAVGKAIQWKKRSNLLTNS